MVRTHILLLLDCVGRSIEFRPTINKEKIAEENILLFELYCTTRFFIIILFYKLCHCLWMYSKYLTPKDFATMLTIGSPTRREVPLAD